MILIFKVNFPQHISTVLPHIAQERSVCWQHDWPHGADLSGSQQQQSLCDGRAGTSPIKAALQQDCRQYSRSVSCCTEEQCDSSVLDEDEETDSVAVLSEDESDSLAVVGAESFSEFVRLDVEGQRLLGVSSEVSTRQLQKESSARMVMQQRDTRYSGSGHCNSHGPNLAIQMLRTSSEDDRHDRGFMTSDSTVANSDNLSLTSATSSSATHLPPDTTSSIKSISRFSSSDLSSSAASESVTESSETTTTSGGKPRSQYENVVRRWDMEHHMRTDDDSLSASAKGDVMDHQNLLLSEVRSFCINQNKGLVL